MWNGNHEEQTVMKKILGMQRPGKYLVDRPIKSKIFDRPTSRPKPARFFNA